MARVGMMLAVVAALGVVTADAARLQTTPMARVVGLLTELEAKIEADGKLEQKSFDKYACWCEETLGRKANDISTGKEQIEELNALIKKLKAEIASHGAEIKQLKKDIAQNIESQREATEVRDKNNQEFEGDKTESEQCIGALEAAIKVLTGAGTKSRGFLETLQEAQLMSVVSGVRSVLKTNHAKSLNSKDLDTVKRFVEHPEDFMGSTAGVMSAAQIANNPFGDYAPQSTQIQGILKGMYDAFTADLEKDNAEEADAQKSHEALMATKAAELQTLQSSLAQQELAEAEKTKKLADSQALRDDTKEQLAADEKFFAETKDACKTKAQEWAQRSRLRTEELQGLGKAIEIMSSPEASKVFTNATTTLIQKADRHSSSKQTEVYSRLRALARQYKSVVLAEIAANVQEGDHFDKVMVAIDKMIALLREEEQEDIKHRDRCQRSENKNANEQEDLAHEISKSDKALGRMGDEKKTLNSEIGSLKKDITATKKDMTELLEMRNEALAEFKQAVKDDTDAVALLDQAITALSSFYKRNQIPMALAQEEPSEPEYTVDPDKAPETNWDGPGYSGRKGETGGIVAIIKMLKEDLEKEIRQGVKDNDMAEQEYEKQRAALQKTLESQTQSKIAVEKELVGLEDKMADVEEYKGQKSGDLADEKKLESSISTDCSWVATHFESRRTKRKNEIDGLEEAKNFLAGVEEV